MKKKLLAILATLFIGVGCLTGCNKQLVDLNLQFTNAYVKIGDEWVNLELSSWTDYEDGEQLQLILKDGTVMVVHSANCVLYKGKLPEVQG